MWRDCSGGQSSASGWRSGSGPLVSWCSRELGTRASRRSSADTTLFSFMNRRTPLRVYGWSEEAGYVQPARSKPKRASVISASTRRRSRVGGGIALAGLSDKGTTLSLWPNDRRIKSSVPGTLKVHWQKRIVNISDATRMQRTRLRVGVPSCVHAGQLAVAGQRLFPPCQRARTWLPSHSLRLHWLRVLCRPRGPGLATAAAPALAFCPPRA